MKIKNNQEICDNIQQAGNWFIRFSKFPTVTKT